MLRESFTESATESLPVMLWRARPDMSCEFLSRQWLEFTGANADEALGDGWSRSVHPEDLTRWLDTCVRSFDAREAFEIEYRLRRRDGDFRWVLDRGLPRYSADRVFVGFVGACIDIDERKRAEHELARSLERERKLRIATEAASRVKDDFLASVLADLQRTNDFLYKEADPHGYRCPIGAHIRRMNPRDTAENMQRRKMIRRGGTYGPPLPAGAPDDGVERGIAAFIGCSSLIRQFEFAMNVWVNDASFHELGNERDPLFGTQDGTFDMTIPKRPIKMKIRGLPSFTTVRGGAYVFLPGIKALRYLTALGAASPV